MSVTPRQARLAVSALFFVNGALYANVVPRLPGIKADLGLSNTALGTAIAGAPVGALLAGAAAGALVTRFGSGRLAVGCGVLFGVALTGVGLAPVWAVLVAAMVVVGALDSVMDVSMNAHGLRVQRAYRRSIINGFHGIWSIGAVAGGLTGAAAAGLGVPIELHLLGAGIALAGAALVASRFLLAGHEDTERVDRQSDAAEPRAMGTRGARRAVLPALGVLGVLTLLAAVVEDSPASWGAVYLSGELGADAATAGLAFVAFQAMMTAGRLLGDRLTERFGEVAVARTGALAAALATSVALAVATPLVTIVGFGVAGFGVASLFPAAFHAAGNIPGVRTGDGVAMVSWIARSGFLIAPPLVGLVGDLVSLRVGLLLVPVAALGVVVLAGALRPAQPAQAGAGVRAGASS